MGGLSLYLHESDVEVVRQWLNAEQEIAFLLSAGEKKWKAVESIPQLPDGLYMLWHIPSGPLPLVGGPVSQTVAWVINPWQGWEEIPSGDPEHTLRKGEYLKMPWLGPHHTGSIQLDIWSQGLPWQREQEPEGIIGISGFGWIGNYFKRIGFPAPKETERWWQRLRRWASKEGKRITREGPIDRPSADVYAFPEALKAIRGGRKRAER